MAGATTTAAVTSAVNAQLTAAGFNTASYTVSIRNAADTADINVSAQTAGTAIRTRLRHLGNGRNPTDGHDRGQQDCEPRHGHA